MPYIWGMARQYKIRFNLGKGPNYMRWKVVSPDGEVNFYHPQEVQILMQYCTLKNNARLATRIFDGENKTVCAWILCQNLAIRRDGMYIRDESYRLLYNPRVDPYWTDGGGRNLDNNQYDHIHTIDSRIYVGH